MANCSSTSSLAPSPPSAARERSRGCFGPGGCGRRGSNRRRSDDRMPPDRGLQGFDVGHGAAHIQVGGTEEDPSVWRQICCLLTVAVLVGGANKCDGGVAGGENALGAARFLHHATLPSRVSVMTYGSCRWPTLPRPACRHWQRCKAQAAPRPGVPCFAVDHHAG